MSDTDKILFDLVSKVSVLEAKITLLQDRIEKLETNSGNDESVAETSGEPKKHERDKTRYSLDGDAYLKNYFVLEVVKKYIQENPAISYDKLHEVFDDKKQGSLGVIRKADEIGDKTVRYFVKHVLHIADCDIVVCNQWGKDNIGNIFKLAASLGYNVAKE